MEIDKDKIRSLKPIEQKMIIDICVALISTGGYPLNAKIILEEIFYSMEEKVKS